jgi:putative (di)nucleoside polyphosphate hydrolase
MENQDNFRNCVGIMLINRDKNVWVGERMDHPGAFQMPQGGVEFNEDPRDAALRELCEETSVDPSQVVMLAESADWHYIHWPKEVQAKAWGGKFKGQKQKWYLLQLTTDFDPTNLDVEMPEFSCHKWSHIDTVADMVVPFKRDVYKSIVDEFKVYL